MQRFALGYGRLARMVMLIAVVHMAVLVHTVCGLVAFGLFPSIGASCAVYRQWLMSEDRSWGIRQIWSAFHAAWRADLRAANLFGWALAIPGLLLLWEYWFVQHNDLGQLGILASGVLLVANLAYLLMTCVGWSVRSHYAERAGWVIRMSASMVVARPLCSLFIVLLLATICYAYYTWPGLAAALGIAVPIFAIMASVYAWGGLPGMNAHDAKEQRARP